MFIARWTIGETNFQGYQSLFLSVTKFASLYPEAELYICYNGPDTITKPDSIIKIINQASPLANGVAWKLYPPRINIELHEIFIDNDLILEEKIPEIDKFLNNDYTLLLEGSGKNYGRFSRHVPKYYQINSGLFGLPPNFNLQKYINYYGEIWNSHFDEQGLVALSLTSKKHIIIPNTTITNCEFQLKRSQGMHFIGLNRRKHHKPFLEYLIKSF